MREREADNGKGCITDSGVRQRLIRRSGLVGIAANLLLAAIKISGGLLISSVAVVSDGLNNLADMLSSSVTLASYYISKKPADEQHPYGHGRFEYVASFIVATMILLTAAELFRASVAKIRNPEPSQLSNYVLYGMLSSIAVKGFLFFFNRRIDQRISSTLIRGVEKDSLFDSLITSGILLGFFLARFLPFEPDGWISFILTVLLFYNGYILMRATVAKLLGEKVDDKLQEEIISVIMTGSYIRGYHHLDLHEYGKERVCGSVHVEVPKNITVEKMHREIDMLEHRIKERFGVTITMHMDPVYEMEADDEDSKPYA